MIRAGETGGFLDERARPDRDRLREGRRAARQDQVRADLPGRSCWSSRSDDHRRPDLHRPDLREDVQAARRRAAAADPGPGRRQPQRCAGSLPLVIVVGCRRRCVLYQRAAAQRAPSSGCGSTGSSCGCRSSARCSRKLAISRFARNLGTLLAVGVPVMQALDVVGGTTGNAVDHRGHGGRAGRGARRPADVGGRCASTPIFPAMVTQMIEVGEESGQISRDARQGCRLLRPGGRQRHRVPDRAIEPIMVLVMGVVVGTMVICLYLPMFTIYQNIQG